VSAAPRPTYFRMTLAEFRRRSFIGRPPCLNTIKATMERGDWVGERIGGLWYIFVDENGQPIPGRPQPPPAPRAPRTGNAEADRLIMEWNQGR
jgi:hypothetical protein